LVGGGSFIGLAAQAAQTGNWGYLAPSGISMVAQAIGETLTRRQISDLSAMIRSGKPITRKLTDQEKRVLSAVATAQAANQGPQ
jgi:hypothetical protein